MKSVPSARFPGFTLIELLVVISVIAVLFGLLVPSLTAIRASAYATTCKSNLRQIYMAHIAYAGDCKGYLPPSSYAVTNLQIPWIQTLSPYCEKADAGSSLKSTDVNYISPIMGCATLKAKIPGLLSSAQFAMGRGYCRNAVLEVNTLAPATVVSDWSNTVVKSFRLASVTYQSKRLLVGDGLANTGWAGTGFESAYARGYPANTASGMGWFYKHLWLAVSIDIGSDNTGVPWTKGYLSGDFHRGKRSYAMCDGSVRSLTDDYLDPKNQLWLSITAPWTL